MTANTKTKEQIKTQRVQITSMLFTLITIGIIVFTTNSSHAQQQVENIIGPLRNAQSVHNVNRQELQLSSTTEETTASPPPPPNNNEFKKLTPGQSVDFGIVDTPRLSWILSFPNSGENDIITFIHKSTGVTTATNYGQNMLSETGRVRYSMVDSIPVYISRPRGPYLYTHHLPVPSTTIPTLTYCGGYCNDCYPGKYMLRRDEFIASCAHSISFEHNEGIHGPTGDGTYRHDKYDSKLVERAVVIIRNPFHVLQDRFLLYSRSYEHLNHRDHEWLPKFVMNNEGFDHYCKIQAVKFADEESKWYEPNIFSSSLVVPCHGDMYRYIHWYNNVFESLDFLNMPYMVVHYDDFDGDYTGVESDMLNFLGLEHGEYSEPPAWYPQGDREFLSDKDKLLLMSFIRSLATPSTLTQIERYL